MDTEGLLITGKVYWRQLKNYENEQCTMNNEKLRKKSSIIVHC
jgi:hypothetical protein